MDPIAVLQSRIEQLEAKLGLAANVVPDSQQGDTPPNQTNAQAVNNVTAGQDKLHAAMHMANELNNYTEPIFNDMTVPVPESAPILQVPEMEATAERMHSTTAELKAEADAPSLGTQEVGAGVAGAFEQLAAPAQHAELTEQTSVPRRRNGLD